MLGDAPELVGPLASDSKLSSTLASYIRWFSLFKRGKSFLNASLSPRASSTCLLSVFAMECKMYCSLPLCSYRFISDV